MYWPLCAHGQTVMEIILCKTNQQSIHSNCSFLGAQNLFLLQVLPITEQKIEEEFIQ